MKTKIHNQGFTLIELMIVVAIIAVLAAVALPAYKEYIISANRADVQAEMVQIAQRIQNYKMVNGTYTGIALGQSSIYGSTAFPKTGKALYTMVLNTSEREGLVIDWTLTATPSNTSSQKDDGTVMLNDLGYKCREKKAATCTLSPNSNWSEK